MFTVDKFIKVRPKTCFGSCLISKLVLYSDCLLWRTVDSCISIIFHTKLEHEIGSYQLQVVSLTSGFSLIKMAHLWKLPVTVNSVENNAHAANIGARAV